MGTLVSRLCHSQVLVASDPQGADGGAELTMLCRCNRISSGGEPAQIGLSACNINASANYMVGQSYIVFIVQTELQASHVSLSGHRGALHAYPSILDGLLARRGTHSWWTSTLTPLERRPWDLP